MKKRLSLLLILSLLLCACSAQPAATAPRPIQAETASPTPAAVKREGAVSLYENTRFLYERVSEGIDCRVEFPALSLDSEDAKAYPELNRALDSLNAEFARQGNEAFKRILNAARSDAELNASPLQPYGRSVSLFIPRADDIAVSVLWMVREYSGGSQESLSYGCRSFDSASGEELDIESLVGDLSLLPGLLESALSAKYPKAEFYGLTDSLSQYIPDSSYVWTLDYQGLSFYFAPYELAPAEDGPMAVSLRFNERPGFFNPNYSKLPSAYALPFVDGSCLGYDMDQDGRADEISISAGYDEAGELITSLDISVNGKHTGANVSVKGYEAYLAHTGPGKNFILISADNGGFGYISVYRLEKSGAALVGMLYDTSLRTAGNSGRLFGKPVLTDPTDFYLGTKIELLSTMTGLKHYSLGNDGMPISADAFYDLCTDVILTAVGEFSTATLDAGTGTGNFSTVKIVPGCKVYFWRSDGEGLVDVYTEDGVYCRLYVSGKGDQQRVNGMAAESCFEGMIYK